MNTPTALPTLSAGAHDPGSGQACVMEYVSLLAGEPWSDKPLCTHPELSSMARLVNDRLADDERHLLVPLIGRLFRTSESGSNLERQILSVRLAAWCARQVLSKVDRKNYDVALTAIKTAEAWAEDPTINTAGTYAKRLTDAISNLYSGTNRDAMVSAYYAASSTHAVDGATDAATAASLVINDKVPFLFGLIDEYDRITGRTECKTLTEKDYTGLTDKVGSL